MPRFPRELIEHERLRCFTQDKKDVIKREIARLLYAGFIKQVYHLDWIPNPILVPKKNKDWRICVDYTDLNKACKKIPSGCPGSIRSWTPLPVAAF
jgi:hypothetical protein